MRDLDIMLILGISVGTLQGAALAFLAWVSSRRGPLLIVAALAYFSCASPIDLARKDFRDSLRAASSVQNRLRSWDAQHQAKIVAEARDRESGAAALGLYRKRKSQVLDVAMRTEATMDAVADELLLPPTPAAAHQSAAKARSAVLELRQAVDDLQRAAP